MTPLCIVDLWLWWSTSCPRLRPRPLWPRPRPSPWPRPRPSLRPQYLFPGTTDSCISTIPILKNICSIISLLLKTNINFNHTCTYLCRVLWRSIPVCGFASGGGEGVSLKRASSLLYPTHNSYKTMINRHHFIIIIIINAIRPMSHLCGISIFRICSV